MWQINISLITNAYAFNALFEVCQNGGDIVNRINQG